MGLNLITAPTTEPLDITAVEGQTRLSGQLTAEANTVNLIIKAIRERAEAATRRALITQTWELTYGYFPSGRAAINLPLPPLQSVVSIKYLDLDNVEQTLNPSLYKVVTSTTGYGYVVPVYGSVWPVALDDVDSVKICFVCGYTFPAFSASVAYAVGQYVIYNGSAYKCKATTTAGDLPTVTAKWDVATLGDAVPAGIKQWMLLNVANLVENRESVVITNGRETLIDASATLADGLIANHRMVRL